MLKAALFNLSVLVMIMNGCSGGWEAIFNGKDLDGWHVECLTVDKGKNFWTVTDGCIECNSLGRPEHGYVWLMSDKEYDDFHLRLEFQAFKSSPGNSGLQFRSRYDTADEQSEGGWLNGPQVDIHPPLPLRTGLIYDETRGVQRWIYPSLPDWEIIPDSVPDTARKTVLLYADDNADAWNTLEVICQGMDIRTFVNGLQVTHFNATGLLDDNNHREHQVGTTGHFALQLHTGDEIQIRFRNISILELSDSSTVD